MEKVGRHRFKEDGRIQGLGSGHVKFEMFPKATSWEQMAIQMYRKTSFDKKISGA